MMYQFNTHLSMKPYNSSKYWITDYVNTHRVNAGDIKQAVLKYRDILSNEYGIDISDTAIKNANPMFNNKDEQTGLVFTATCMFDKGDYTGYTKQFIDVWAEILKTDYVSFDEF